MTKMTRPDCVVMCNLINTHTHTHKQHTQLWKALDDGKCPRKKAIYADESPLTDQHGILSSTRCFQAPVSEGTALKVLP